MTLAELFVAVNAAGVRLSAVNGQLELRGPITPQIEAAAAEHKAVIMAMLAPASGETSIPIPDGPPSTAEDRAEAEAALKAALEERQAIIAEATGRGTAEVGNRLDHDWRDWRLEWMLYVGTLYLRMRDCRDAEVLAILKPLADATPATREEWLVLGRRILDAEHELRQRGRLPNYPWPASR